MKFVIIFADEKDVKLRGKQRSYKDMRKYKDEQYSASLLTIKKLIEKLSKNPVLFDNNRITFIYNKKSDPDENGNYPLPLKQNITDFYNFYDNKVKIPIKGRMYGYGNVVYNLNDEQIEPDIATYSNKVTYWNHNTNTQNNQDQIDKGY